MNETHSHAPCTSGDVTKSLQNSTISQPRIKHSRLRTALAALTLPAILLTTACGQGPSGSAATVNASEPQSGGTLRIAQPVDPYNCIDPFQTGRASTRAVIRNIAESLVDQDPKTGDIKPWLAEKYSISDDGKTSTFDLKHGIIFSNGEKFDADAVVANFNDILDPSHAVSTGSQFVSGLESVSKVDDDTVQLHLSEVNSSFLQALAMTNLAIVAPSYLKEVPFIERCSAGKVIGTGPFTLKKFDNKTKTVLTKRAGYTSASPFSKHKGDAYLDTIEVNYVPESSVRIGSLNGGQIDVIWLDNDAAFSENDAAQIKQGGNTIQSRAVPGTAWNLYPNVSSDRPLSDPKVLKALSLGIDRTTYAHTTIRADYPTVKGVLGTTTPGYKANPKSATYDPEAAGKLLDQAGWKLDDDGYRHKDGKKLTLHFVTYSKETDQELIQDELKQIGIDYQIDIIASSELASRAASGDYDLTRMTWTRADPSALQAFYQWSGQWGPVLAKNKTAEQKAHLDTLFDKARVTLDTAERNSIYQQIQQYIEDNYIVIPIFQRQQDAALSPKVHDVRFTADSFPDYSGTWLG